MPISVVSNPPFPPGYPLPKENTPLRQPLVKTARGNVSIPKRCSAKLIVPAPKKPVVKLRPPLPKKPAKFVRMSENMVTMFRYEKDKWVTEKATMRLQEWQQMIRTAKEGETLKAKVEMINGKRVLRPEIEKTKSIFYRFWLWLTQGEARHENKKNAALCLKVCIAFQRVKKGTLEEFDDTLALYQLIENDSELQNHLGKKNVRNLRAKTSEQFLNVIRQETKQESLRHASKARLEKVKGVWKKAFETYQLIWQCWSDKQGRLPLVNITMEHVDERLEQIAIREKKIACIEKLRDDLHSLKKDGALYLQALESFVKQKENVQKKPLMDFLKNYRKINQHIAEFSASFDKCLNGVNVKLLPDQELDRLTGMLATLYEESFTPLIADFKTITYDHCHIKPHIQEVRKSESLKKEWWNKLPQEAQKLMEKNIGLGKKTANFLVLFQPSQLFIDFYGEYAEPLCTLRTLISQYTPEGKKLTACIHALFSNR